MNYLKMASRHASRLLLISTMRLSVMEELLHCSCVTAALFIVGVVELVVCFVEIVVDVVEIVVGIFWDSCGY